MPVHKVCESPAQAVNTSDRVIESVIYCCAELLFEATSESMDRLADVQASSKETQILSESIGNEMGEESDRQTKMAMNDGIETSSRPRRALYSSRQRDSRVGDWHEAKTIAIYDTKERVKADGSKEEIANEITCTACRESPDEFQVMFRLRHEVMERSTQKS